MMTMADMMVTLITGFAIGLGKQAMSQVRAGVRIMIMKMRPDGMVIAADMNMHAHHRRPGKLDRENEQQDQGEQTAHAPNATSANSPLKPCLHGRHRQSG